MKIKLNKKLFWDIDYQKIDYQKNSNFVIERVLNYGDKKDWQNLKKLYSLRKIKKVIPKLNYINQKSKNFWSLLFNIPLTSFEKKFKR